MIIIIIFNISIRFIGHGPWHLKTHVISVKQTGTRHDWIWSLYVTNGKESAVNDTYVIFNMYICTPLK